MLGLKVAYAVVLMLNAPSSLISPAIFRVVIKV
jgi:hypothetical protein